MDRKAKTPKRPCFTRVVVADNLVNLLRKHYPSEPNITRKQKQFAADSKVPFSTIQRICNEEVGGNLETLESIATAFDLTVYQLMIPGLDVGNPQLVKGATVAEQRLYARWRKINTGAAPKPTTRTTGKATTPPG